jgi:hypothetical protein
MCTFKLEQGEKVSMPSINKLTEKVRMTEGQKEVARQRQRRSKLQRTIIMVTAANLLHV